MIKNFFDSLNVSYKEDISLKNYNTYRVNTICKFLVFPKTIEELKLVLDYLRENNIKYYILGNGSNVILSMDYYDGVMIKLDNFNSVIYKDNLVTAGAGYSLIKLSLDTIEKGFSGMEFSAGIPGAVGASVAMNAGAYNSDISEILKEVTVLTPDNEVKIMKNSELEYAYRSSFLKRNKKYIVLDATFELQKGNSEEMKELVEERKQKRIASQPLDMPNAGSVFRNPEGGYAGALIEEANLKGYNINGAEVSTKHANFIVNKNGATGKDIISLIEKIQKEIKEKYNIELKLEQIIVR
ncbi:MAG: UDP-N-acetylmuramate dehydrogenase [Bacilli bacterium]|nr:UDP-N-acetylmuramate dehydrogenase [Bacilli bacterium]